jgi:hypothetical protein
MHILAGLFAIITLIAVWYWRIKMLRDAAGEAGKVVQTVANAPRRLAYRFKASKDGLALIEDPREAAAAMLVAMALARGGETLSEAQSKLFFSQVQATFGFTKAEADDLLAQALFIHRSTGDAPLLMNKLSSLILQSSALTQIEKTEFYAMLVGMSECGGLPVREQIALLQIYQSKAGLLH